MTGDMKNLRLLAHRLFEVALGGYFALETDLSSGVI